MTILDPATTDPVQDHLDYLAHLNRRPGTIYQRRRVLERLREFAECPLLEATPETLYEFCTQSTLDVESRATTISHLRQFYGWAHREDLLDANPAARLERPRRTRRLPRPMADDRAALAIRHAQGDLRAWLYLAAYAGLRACEIAPLRGEDLLLDQESPVILIEVSKGGDGTSVPVADELLPVLRTLPREGWCFPGGPRSHTPHVSANRVSQRANLYLHGLGIPDTLHSLRHWFGTHTYRATGRDLRATQELLRHKSPVSTAIYTYVDPGEGINALNRLPRLGNS